MYSKIAINNVKKSFKDYTIYFLTIAFAVCIFYSFNAIDAQKAVLDMNKSQAEYMTVVTTLISYVSVFVSFILGGLILYANNFLIKKRKKELGIYMTLGMKKSKISKILLGETLIVGILSLAAGLLLGVLLSQGLSLFTAKLFEVDMTEFKFIISFGAISKTILYFAIIFGILMIFNTTIVSRYKLIDMLNAHKQVEFKFKRSGKVYSAIFVVSIILYVICGSCTIKLMNSKIDYSVRMLMYIGISLITFILGTYALFYSIAYIMIYIKNKRINFKYEGTNLFLIGSIVSKIKTAPVLMATISMTFLGAMISFIITLVMAQWALGYLNMRVPYDIDIRNNYSTSFLEQANISDFKELPKLDYSMVVEYLNDSGYEVKNYCEVEKYILEPDGSNEQLLAISLSDFNKLRNMLGYEEVKLEDNEFATQWYSTVTDEVISNYLDNNYELNINGQTYNINENLVYKDSIGEGFYLNTDNIIILSDKACEGLEFAEINFLANIKDKMSYEDANDFQYNYVYDWFRKDNAEFIKKYSKEYDISYSIIRTRIKSLETNNILVTTLAMRILGIYLGVVLLMISLTVLSLSQLTDSIEHKDRFNILRKLGVEDKEVNKIILKQISIYFIVPIFIAMIGVAIFIYNFYIFYKDIITVFVGDGTFILSIIFGMALMLCVYICYFGGTYYTFKRNINT
ncbi:MAG: FtsX-like permease family protein [Clostridium celatum]|nr:FtsX-like permease family protein [Clostridium celatum]